MSYAIPIGGPYPPAHPEHQAIEEAKRRFLAECYTLAPPIGPVVEVGMMRYDGVAADGRSTLLFARFCQRDRRRFVSIDSSPDAIETAAIALTREKLNDVELRLGDGAEILAQHQGEIALLYLDAGDHPAEALAQFEAAQCHLTIGAVIVVDDCHPYEAMNIPRAWAQPMPEGKGTKLLPSLRFLGATVEVVRVTEAWAMARAIWPVKHH